MNTAAKVQPGWTLTNIYNGGSSPAIIVIVDETGLPVWYFVHGKTNDQFGMTSTNFLPNSTSCPPATCSSATPARSPRGRSISRPTSCGRAPPVAPRRCSHHTGKLMNGDYAVVRESNASARVEELDPTMSNTVVWTWDLYQHYIKPKTTAADWCHLNSVTFDEVNNFLYFNCRFQGLFKVNRADELDPLADGRRHRRLELRGHQVPPRQQRRASTIRTTPRSTATGLFSSTTTKVGRATRVAR